MTQSTDLPPSEQPATPLEALTPRHEYDAALDDGENPFRKCFGDLDESEWLAVLKRSLTERVIDGVEFPRFPGQKLQSRIHGSVGEASLVQAHSFYSFTREHTYKDTRGAEGRRFLDFGAGWGRITIPFLRDFSARNMFGYEPNLLFCTVARALNPYSCFIHGSKEAGPWLPGDWFDVVVAYSIFSHLGEAAARAWLVEINRATRPAGWCVITTWGSRFLDRLDQGAEKLGAGETLEWYDELCVRTAGDLGARREEYDAGEFVYFGQGDPNYGETLISEPALRTIVREEGLDFELERFDTTSLAQDAFVLRRPS